ncbi:hypothetical protein [Frankia sp. QA3]|uniref:hypothetical protein n=1 Tax=Frankia sp. QA3 TaxID=710111 RepID=UPI000269BC9B|nr:hypothetical protein [Frankia sp. QA3]EIV91328.1 hypothetical protein FraQA3DRAFT_0769 [Frankia sp. QA3]
MTGPPPGRPSDPASPPPPDPDPGPTPGPASSGKGPSDAPVDPPPPTYRSPTPARPRTTDLAGPRLKVARLHPSGLLLDLPFTPPPGAAVYVATFWPESTAPNGWSYLQWERGPHGRGLQLPQIIDLGDVLGFRAVTRPQLAGVPRSTARPGSPPPSPAVHVIEWWGYLHAVERGALVLHGPHPTLPAAYAAAQHALAAQVWAPDAADRSGRGPTAGGPGAHPSREPAWREPAQPPASVSLTWHGDTATVSDPRFGWLHVDADDLAAALTLRSDDLVRALRPLVRGIDGTEPPVTLAALAALHLPDLPNIHTTPPPPTPPPPEPPPPVPDAAQPEAPTGPDLDGPS